MVRLFLVRHGESEYSKEGRLGGNSGLTEKGIKQAEKLGDELKKFDIDRVYCSFLKRSIETAKIINRQLGKKEIKVQELNELDTGKLTGKTYDDFEKQFPESYKKRKENGFNWNYPGGESYKGLIKRIKPFVDFLLNEEGNCLIAGHRGVNRAIIGYLLDLKENEIPYLDINHTAIFIVEIDNSKKGFVIENGEKREFKAKEWIKKY